MIQYIKGDLIQEFDKRNINILIHQCNCTTGIQVAGFAKALQNKYPKINKSLEFKGDKFGKAYYTSHKDSLIFNCFSQYYPGKPSNSSFMNNGLKLIDSHKTRLEALRQCLNFIIEDYIQEGDNVAMPLIASGLAANKELKQGLTDLEYFVKHIEPTVKDCFKNMLDRINLKVYYL